MQFPLDNHVLLGCIPKRIMCLEFFKLIKVIDVFPCILSMLVERLFCPIRKTVKGIIIPRIEAKIVCEIAAHNKFFQENIFCFAVRICFCYCQGNLLCTDMTKMQIW